MVYVTGPEFQSTVTAIALGVVPRLIPTFPTRSCTLFLEETPENWLPYPLIPIQIINLVITIKSARTHHPLKDSYLLERVEPENDPNPYDAWSAPKAAS